MLEPSTQLAARLTAEEEKLLACVHCGLCLEACPTYVHTGDENDSPRGRIYLMRAVKESRLAAESETFARHINRCLGCRACEAACPAGVEYGHLLEAARETVADKSQSKRKNQLLQFILRRIWLHPKRLGFFLRATQFFRDARLAKLSLRFAPFLPSRWRFALSLLESSSPARDSENFTRVRSAQLDESKKSNGAVSLFTGCVMNTLFARVNRATRRVLEANGYAVRVPHAQVCCGALHLHAGDREAARVLARRNLDAFGEALRDSDQATIHSIITNAGGCGAMLAGYDHLLSDDANYSERAREFSRRVRDIGQQLMQTEIKRGTEANGAEDDAAVTYDASCHLLYGQRAATDSLEALRQAVPDMPFVPLAASDVCCGGAGVYNLLEPELSARVLDEKLRCIKATGASVLATGNPGCHMQIAAGAELAGMNLRVCHPIELIDEAYKRAGIYGE